MPPKTPGEFHETPTSPQLCRQAARNAERNRVSGNKRQRNGKRKRAIPNSDDRKRN